MTDVILLPLDEAARLPERYGETHFPLRMERARRFLRAEDRLRCIGAGALLHGILGISEEELMYSEYGKPLTPNQSVSFSLSHSGKYVLLAVDRRAQAIGADIEIIHPEHICLANYVFQPQERTWMREDPATRFFTLWTLKESVMKQCGLGMSLPPESFSVMPLVNGECLFLNGHKLFAATEMTDGHCISVCTDHPLDTLTFNRITAERIL